MSVTPPNTPERSAGLSRHQGPDVPPSPAAVVSVSHRDQETDARRAPGSNAVVVATGNANHHQGTAGAARYTEPFTMARAALDPATLTAPAQCWNCHEHDHWDAFGEILFCGRRDTLGGPDSQQEWFNVQHVPLPGRPEYQSGAGIDCEEPPVLVACRSCQSVVWCDITHHGALAWYIDDLRRTVRAQWSAPTLAQRETAPISHYERMTARLRPIVCGTYALEAVMPIGDAPWTTDLTAAVHALIDALELASGRTRTNAGESESRWAAPLLRHPNSDIRQATLLALGENTAAD